MADVIQELTVKASPERVFQAMGTPDGLARWWTKRSTGDPREGAEYSLMFGPGYDWTAVVTRYAPDSAFELKLTKADRDWLGTRVGCELQADGDVTRVRFYHTGWPEENQHWRISCHCWAMYLRIMRRYLEHGETVPYEDRLDV